MSWSIVNSEETLKSNLSGPQIVNTLHVFLEGALKPLNKLTSLVQRCMSDILVQAYNDSRRKISSLDKQKALNAVFSAAVSDNYKSRFSFLKKARLDRALLFKTLLFFQKHTRNYSQYSNNYLNAKSWADKVVWAGRMVQIEEFFCVSRKRMFSLVRWVNHYISLYQQFKGMVISKYTRLAFVESQRSAASTKIHVDDKELFKNLILAIDIAIDKYDPNFGTLTSYVRKWFMNAKTNPEFDHQYGQSYLIPGGYRSEHSKKGNSFSVDLDNAPEILDDSLNAEDSLLSQADKEGTHRLVCSAKDSKVARLVLGIPYIFSMAEFKLLQSAECR